MVLKEQSMEVWTRLINFQAPVNMNWLHIRDETPSLAEQLLAI
jgi:hypothetical protein